MKERKMFELTINNETYKFEFNIGFAKKLNKTQAQEVPNMKGVYSDCGVSMAMAEIYDGNIFTLIDVLHRANEGFAPRVTQAQLEEYVDDETTDIEKLVSDVLDFFGKSNSCKMLGKDTLKLIAEMEQASV